MEENIITPSDAQLLKKQMDKFFDDKVKGFDLSKLECLYLVHLFNKDGVSLIELTNAVCLDKANTTRVICDLEKRGLVIRKENEKDNRKYKIFLTEKAEPYRESLVSITNELNKKVFKGVTKCERKSFFKVMQKIYTNVNKL